MIMCTNYQIDVVWLDLAQHFGLGDAPEGFTGGQIRPADKALVIGPDGASSAVCWGIPAPWDGKPLINARSETLAQKQTFRPLLENRCLVPASAYFEWRHEGKLRLKNTITLKHSSIMAFAGLRLGDHFTIITCQPSPSIAHIHNRMPVILTKQGENEWADQGRPFGDVEHLLQPYDADALFAHEDAPPPIIQPGLFD